MLLAIKGTVLLVSWRRNIVRAREVWITAPLSPSLFQPPSRAHERDYCRKGKEVARGTIDKLTSRRKFLNVEQRAKREREREELSRVICDRLIYGPATGIPPRWNLRGGRDPRSALRIYSRIPSRRRERTNGYGRTICTSERPSSVIYCIIGSLEWRSKITGKVGPVSRVIANPTNSLSEHKF